MLTQTIEISRLEYFARTAHSMTIYLDKVIRDDGAEISRSNVNTRAFTPDKFSEIQPWLDAQLTEPNATIAAMVGAAWTPEIVADRQAFLEAQRIEDEKEKELVRLEDEQRERLKAEAEAKMLQEEKSRIDAAIAAATAEPILNP